MLAELTSSDIRLWYCPLAGLDAQLRQACRMLLDGSERLRLERYISTDAADQFLVGRALARCGLSLYAPGAPADWRFETNGQGKPRLAARHGADWLSFNISNTRGMVACALGRDAAIGVDIEADRQTYDPGIAERFFTSSETSAIETAHPGDRAARFLKTWTLKEAVVKATGLGLSCPLSAFDVDIDAHSPRVAFSQPMPEDPRNWQLFSLPLESTYTAAVAVRRYADRGLRLIAGRLPLEAILGRLTDARQ